MKNLTLTFITLLLLLSIGNAQAQNSPTTISKLPKKITIAA